MNFLVCVIFFFQFRITWLFCNVLFFNIWKLIWLIIYLDSLRLLICLLVFWLLLTLFLLASLLVRLLTLSLSINIKHLCLFFHSLPILTDFFKFWPSPPPSYFDPPLPFIKHLRVCAPYFLVPDLKHWFVLRNFYSQYIS